MLFYDFEVFRYDWMLVAIASDKTRTAIVNDAEQLAELYQKHQSDIWVGYNSRNYDRYILKAILCGMDPYRINDWIINKHRQGWEYSDLFRQIPLNDYDVFNGFHGLKTLEAFMGNDIRETSVPFDIDRRLTDSEIQETIGYCTHDVEQTIEVFLRRQDDFKAHMELLRSFGLPLREVSKSKAQLIARILDAERVEHDDEFELSFPATLRLSRYASV